MIYYKQRQSVFSHTNLGAPKTQGKYYFTRWVGAFVLAGFMMGSIAQEASDSASMLDAQAASADGIEMEADVSGYQAEEEAGAWDGSEIIEFPESEEDFKDPPEGAEALSEESVEGEMVAETTGEEEEEPVDYGAPDEDIPELESSSWDFPPPPEDSVGAADDTEFSEEDEKKADAEVTQEDVDALADEDILPEDEPLLWDSEPDSEGVTADATDNGMIGEEITPSGISMDGSVDKYIGRKWLQFSFRKNTPARGCSPADRGGLKCGTSRAKNSVFANAPPWTFNTSSYTRLHVTDAFQRTDRFKVYDSGKLLGETSKPSGKGSCGSDPGRCYSDRTASSGYFDLNPGKHVITIVPSMSSSNGAAYFLVAKRSGPAKNRGVLQFHSRSYRVSERSRSIAVIVTRRGGSYANVSVRYSTANRSARSKQDYVAKSGTLVWKNGDSRAKVIRVNIVNDTVKESAENFTVHLSNVRGGAKLGSWRATSVTIVDDDKAPLTRCNAVYNAKSRNLYIPLINIPLLDPITGRPIGKSAVFRGSLQLVEGVEDFKVIPSSMSFVKMLTKNNKCHATYSYTNRMITIPYVNVPSVMVVPPNVVVPGPTQVFHVRLQLLPLSEDIFHLVYYRYRYTYK